KRILGMRIKISKLLTFTAIVLLAACKREEKTFEEPYGEGKSPLGILINPTQVPSPVSGLPGTVVEIKATGLMQYKDEIVFRFNGEEADIVEVTDSGIKAVVPDYASSGVTSISVGDRVVFGPIFSVDGLLSIDPTFRAVNGTNGGILQRMVTDDRSEERRVGKDG